MNDRPRPPADAGVVTDDRFTWRWPGRAESVCGLELWCLADGRTVVIVSERRDNPGVSVTNGAEYLVSEVCRRRGLDVHRLIWIEHYPAEPLPGAAGAVQRRRQHGASFGRMYRPTWDLVTFPLVPVGGGMMVGSPPRWRPATVNDFLELGSTPPPSLAAGEVRGE